MVIANEDSPSQSFSIHPELLLSVMDGAASLLNNQGRVRLTNRKMDVLFATDEGQRILPFSRHNGALRLGAADAYDAPLRSVVLGLEEVIAGRRERFDVTLNALGASLVAIACSVDGGRGVLVSARVRTADDLHRASALESVEAMPLGLNVFHLEDLDDETSLRCIYGNPAAEQISKIPANKFVNHRLVDVMRSNRNQGLLTSYQKVVLEKKPMDIEVTTPATTTSASMTFAIKAFPLSGQCVGAVFDDLTKQRAMERSLQETSQFLQTILENIPMIIFIKEARELRYVHTNRFLVEALGESVKSWIGKNDRELFPREIADLFIAKDREVFEKRTLVDIPQEEVPTEDGKVLICHTRKVPLYDANGEPLYLIGLSEDITERKKAEDAQRRELVLLETQEKLMELVRQLSTPLLPLAEGILVAPLVGQLDERRGEHFLEALLEGIQQWQATTVLIDITGVPSMDANVAEQLMRATRAARLLGTEAALVGVSPNVARTLVELGVDFSGLVTHGDLRSGIRAAEQKSKRGLGKPNRKRGGDS
jgi:PAS domain S-box-containing protein